MPSTPEPHTPLAVLGLSADDERLYRLVLRRGRTQVTDLTVLLDLPGGQVADWLARLAEHRLVRLEGEQVTAVPPAEALGVAIEEERHRIRQAETALDDLRRHLVELTAEHGAMVGDEAGAVRVQAVTGNPGDELEQLVAASTGDLLWMRPDMWQQPVVRPVEEAVDALLARGRRSRSLFPARVLELAPEVLRARVAAGEQVRVTAAVPTRMAIFGDQAALLPDRWGESTGRRLLVREQSLVAALTEVFETLWERALIVPGLDDGPVRGNPRDDERRLLLDQLSRGAKDEQIARALGMSLRTVRRRVSDLMLDLGVESRFQAGVEAVRRGWV